jgi:hypothetical protein|uniref:Uncharacterized protein n=1 Tax=viral metagenome TaxID=1070528 RepID=A0A6C0I0S5_9ZZZZ
MSIQPSYSQSTTQKQLILENLMTFYQEKENLTKLFTIINGESKLSLRIIDWFVTNYAKKNYTVYDIPLENETKRFKVHHDYKLKLKAYSKKNFDTFCRWERISIPYEENRYIETTIGQLNFFKWAIDHHILEYIEENYKEIENDMNSRNSTSKKKEAVDESGKTRKKREELSISACKYIKKETVSIVVKFS